MKRSLNLAVNAVVLLLLVVAFAGCSNDSSPSDTREQNLSSGEGRPNSSIRGLVTSLSSAGKLRIVEMDHSSFGLDETLVVTSGVDCSGTGGTTTVPPALDTTRGNLYITFSDIIFDESSDFTGDVVIERNNEDGTWTTMARTSWKPIDEETIALHAEVDEEIIEEWPNFRFEFYGSDAVRLHFNFDYMCGVPDEPVVMPATPVRTFVSVFPELVGTWCAESGVSNILFSEIILTALDNITVYMTDEPTTPVMARVMDIADNWEWDGIFAFMYSPAPDDYAFFMLTDDGRFRGPSGEYFNRAGSGGTCR